ncbi:leucine-rich repeat-containing protein 56 [Neodiprion lecontei]|uniref:Leucine-rich repeat-containing protein 56 n=1 Tax=Neodiprion lecontei TaxID=441921 RepID=A0A6J0BAA5_NEOLC|nr:leucine-rich repeat-containing protein 56 [Neodiprion lecontei]
MEAIRSKSTDSLHAKDTQHPITEAEDSPLRSREKLTYTFSTQPLEIDLRNLLTQVTGQTDLIGVTNVKLKVVSGQAGLHRLSDYTPHLTTLTLDGSCIATFRDLGSSLKSLSTLSVARCSMKHLDGVWGFRNLRDLNARDNFISDPSPCSGVRKLSKLDLGNNKITNVSYFAFLRSCNRLKELDVAANNFTDYKTEITRFLPQLRVLDGEELEDRHRHSDVTEEGSAVKIEDQSSEEESTTSEERLSAEDVDPDEVVGCWHKIVRLVSLM